MSVLLPGRVKGGMMNTASRMIRRYPSIAFAVTVLGIPIAVSFCNKDFGPVFSVIGIVLFVAIILFASRYQDDP